ncbi:uncharacterized protein LOC143354858 [Halictus rubicundus]|uniref:uncharacterized protein LOC143354858 n=1 Tax=Halictus rubicundus TaxID=77578 RepID=UPI0040354039
MTYNSMTQLVSDGTGPLLDTYETLLAEIKRLRKRLICLESENAATSVKLNQQHREVKHRLAEIEMQIQTGSSWSVEDNERNRETYDAAIAKCLSNVDRFPSRYTGEDQEEPEGARISGRSSDTKSIGSLSQHFFESDEDEKFFGTCNGYASQPGSKSNLLLCSECDQKSRTCTYRPQTPGSYSSRYVEERFDDQLQTPGTSRSYRSPVRGSSPQPSQRDQETNGQSSSQSSFCCEQEYQVRQGWSKKHEQDSNGHDHYRDKLLDQEDELCELCHGNGREPQCEHCDCSSDGNLICFQCERDESSSNGRVCPRCEAGDRGMISGKSRSQRAAASSSDEGKYPVDAVVKIQVNDHAMDGDSDETTDNDVSGGQHHHRSPVERLDTIVEVKESLPVRMTRKMGVQR